MIDRYPAISQALEFLEKLVSTTPPATRLPGYRRIAADAKVSFNTMRKAIDIVRGEGRIKVVLGQGITTAGSPSISPSHPAQNRKWQLLSNMIRNEMLLGQFDPHRPLPQLKQLQQRYSVSFITIKRALDALVNEGTLESCKSSYWTAKAAITSPGLTSGKIIFISHGAIHERLVYSDPRIPDLLRAMEFECSMAGLKLEMIGYSDVGDKPQFIIASGERVALDFQKRVLGYMLFVSDISDPQDLLRYLNSSGKPISILSGNRAFSLPAIKYSSQIRLFLVGDTAACGFDIGRYLIQLGHRRVAFISPYNRSDWSGNRLDGLRAAFQQAGIEDGVAAYVNNERQSYDIDHLNEVVRALKTSEIRLGNRHFPQMVSLKSEKIERGNQSPVHTREILNYMVPLFEAALEDREITAWVCGMDYIALIAQRFLASRGIAVPQRLSLIGFDNIQSSLESGLSTYHFDLGTLAHNMLIHIIQPVWRPFLNVNRFTEINGRIIERETTATAIN
jgi:DNA-binding LacI/PurR family transcriptional regulator/DNA-binding transcriptional regulator YhcF (GntR family)